MFKRFETTIGGLLLEKYASHGWRFGGNIILPIALLAYGD